jgi:hypothetical protein
VQWPCKILAVEPAYVGTGERSNLASGICAAGAKFTGARLIAGKYKGVCSSEEVPWARVAAGTFRDVVVVVFAPTVPSGIVSVDVHVDTIVADELLNGNGACGNRSRNFGDAAGILICCLSKRSREYDTLFALRHSLRLYSSHVF